MEMDNPKKKKKPKPARQGTLNSELQTDIPVPKFKRRKKESVGAYLNRMNQETQHVMFLSKNQPDRCPEMEEEEEVVGEEKEGCAQKKKSQKKKDGELQFSQKWIKSVLDKVQFGEVAMEPPIFTSKPRKSTVQTKPGEKPLLLKKLLGAESRQSNPPVLSLARKRLIDEERERVIQAYRQLKKQKVQSGKEISFQKS
eukprot:XP_017953304.1 PREDICTED: coiled-coil domain-containing protein 137-like [Xenopus tropicalis]